MIKYGAGVVIVEDNKVLLLLRKNSSTFNELWANPGGLLEPGESDLEAALREAREEIGVEVEAIEKIAEYQDMKEGKLFGIYSGFLGKIVKGTPSIQEKDKAEKLEWFRVDQLPNNLAPYTKLYLKTYLSAYRKE